MKLTCLRVIIIIIIIRRRRRRRRTLAITARKRLSYYNHDRLIARAQPAH